MKRDYDKMSFEQISAILTIKAIFTGYAREGDYDAEGRADIKEGTKLSFLATKENKYL